MGKFYLTILLAILSFLFSFATLAQQHFVPVWTNNPYLPMNVYISSANIDSLPLTSGDEIGIFDGNLCVGSIKLSGSISPNNPVGIITSTDDPLTPQKDGFTPGNTISFKIWDAFNQREIFNCLPDYQVGSGIFISLGSTLLKLSGFSVLKISPLKVLIEGLFDGTIMIPDTIKVELRSESFPYELLDSTFILTDSLGVASAEFSDISLNRSFYIVIRHHNSIETWSKFPVSLAQAVGEYDFTADSSKAYGNNLTKKEGRWCIYSGDINQDGLIDSVDLQIVFLDNISGVENSYDTDLNRDNFTEVYDVILTFKNFLQQVEKKTPE